jgi:hypothetical protein
VDLHGDVVVVDPCLGINVSGVVLDCPRPFEVGVILLANHCRSKISCTVIH